MNIICSKKVFYLIHIKEKNLTKVRVEYQPVRSKMEAPPVEGIGGYRNFISWTVHS
jgi:hypothetical protein